MVQGYVPFSSFAGWATTYDGSLVDEVTAQLQAARTKYGDATADRAVEVASRYAAVDTGAIEGLYATSRGFTRTIAERSANWEAVLEMHPEAACTRSRTATAAWPGRWPRCSCTAGRAFRS